MNLLNFKYIARLSIAILSVATFFSVEINAQTITSTSKGTHDGFYYYFWKDSGDASFKLEQGGRYTAQWTNNTNSWVGGKGWKVGNRSRVINYSGNAGISANQNTFLSLQGWTRSPLIEYYIVESYGAYNPATCAGGSIYGSFQSDGATYTVSRCQRGNQLAIDGSISGFYQYYSVRNPKKGFGNISGTITFANHAAFWASKGLALGTTFDYQIMAVEGYQSTGKADITVSEATATNSSSAISSFSGTSSSSSSSVSISNNQCRCNWYGTVYPSCVATKTGWGWENNKTCISDSACNDQPSSQGGLVCGMTGGSGRPGASPK